MALIFPPLMGPGLELLAVPDFFFMVLFADGCNKCQKVPSVCLLQHQHPPQTHEDRQHVQLPLREGTRLSETQSSQQHANPNKQAEERRGGSSEATAETWTIRFLSWSTNSTNKPEAQLYYSRIQQKQQQADPASGAAQ